MLSYKKISLLLLSAVSLLCSIKASAQNVEILFTGIESNRGQIIVKIFTDEKSFQEDKGVKAVKFSKSTVVNGQMTGKLILDAGVYGFALLDDENSNGTMEYNMFGMPKEGFGFSNFYLSGLKKPKFEQFKFTLGKNQQMKVNMKLRYL